jgi:hypothetical protein
MSKQDVEGKSRVLMFHEPCSGVYRNLKVQGTRFDSGA